MNASTSTGETPSLASIEFFIRRWKESGGSEIGNAQPFIKELSTDVLGVAPPEPASARVEKNTYVFERRVTFTNGKGRSTGRIDCYKRGHFVLEAKLRSDVDKHLMRMARRIAALLLLEPVLDENYARSKVAEVSVF